MKIDEKPAWVLEAKSPTEPINSTQHAEQAYSYAIHPEIRVNYFGLCNGWEFVVYNISDAKPIFHIPMSAMDRHLDLIKELLAPANIFSPKEISLAKDLGLHVKRIGFTPSEIIHIIGVSPLEIIKYGDDQFSFTAPVCVNETDYLGTFDFNLETAMELEPLLGAKFPYLLTPVTNAIIRFTLPKSFCVNISISLPPNEQLIEVEKEIYLPLAVNHFHNS
jgi:hypothetical protein